MPERIYVGGVPFSMSNDGLRALFTDLGAVESAVLVTDKTTGYSRGFGFVEMTSPQAAATAVKKLHRLELDGRKITVQLIAAVQSVNERADWEEGGEG
jgi:RNA recognition motif-containing protein